MSIQNKIGASNGITVFLHKYEIGKTPRNFRKLDEFINNILIEFGKENNIEGIEQNNSPRYRGHYCPLIENGPVIQENWKLFSNWVRDKYEKKKEM